MLLSLTSSMFMFMFRLHTSPPAQKALLLRPMQRQQEADNRQPTPSCPPLALLVYVLLSSRWLVLPRCWGL
jgi:hypothetical protein